MKIRTAVSAVALLVVTGAAASAETTTEVEVLTERVNFAIDCVQEGSDPRCVSTAYNLSTAPGDSSVGNALTISPAGYALWAAEGYSVSSFAGDTTLRPEYTLVGGSEITGQVTYRAYNDAPALAADAGVQVSLFATRVDNRRSVTLGDVEVTKTAVTPDDASFAFTFVVPEELDGVAVKALSADVGQRWITAGYGFMDGEGLSFFDLPHVVPAEVEPAA